jgi:hypothetical protein
LTDPPADYLQVASGIGHAPPKTIVVYPFSHENTLVGILEFGLQARLDDHLMEFCSTCRQPSASP